VYGFCDTGDSASFQNAVYACIDDISAWISSNRLQLNVAKTEVMWCASSRRMHLVPAVPHRVGADNVTPVSFVQDLGVYLDADASMTTHISRTAASCFGILRQLRSIQRSLPRHAVVSLVTSLVLTKLDYCNSLLVGFLAKLLNRLQAVINTAARLVCRAMKADHVTPVLKDLHWLRIQEKIQYKLCVTAFKCQHSLAPPYLSDQLHQVARMEPRQHLRSLSSPALVVLPTRRSSLGPGDRAFLVAAARAWNSLPSIITAASTLYLFRRALKTHLFTASFPPS